MTPQYVLVCDLGGGSIHSKMVIATPADDPDALVGTMRDVLARSRMNVVAENFAVGVFNMVHCFSPELVVIGGGMSRAGDLLLDTVRRALRQCGESCPASRAKVVRAQGDDDVGLLAGIAYWSDPR